MSFKPRELVASSRLPSNTFLTGLGQTIRIARSATLRQLVTAWLNTRLQAMYLLPGPAGLYTGSRSVLWPSAQSVSWPSL